MKSHGSDEHQKAGMNYAIMYYISKASTCSEPRVSSNSSSCIGSSKPENNSLNKESVESDGDKDMSRLR